VNRARDAPRLAGVASTVQRLAVLLAAGVPPTSAWRYLAESPTVAGVDAAIRGGMPVAEAIVAQLPRVAAGERAAWRGLAAAWWVAADVGAPLAPSLREFAASLRSLSEAQREIAVALSAPVATARLVMALPAVGLLFGFSLGFDTLGVLFTTVPGLACLALGIALMLAALAWNRRLVAAAQPRDLTPGLRFELTAIAVTGGGALDRAVASVSEALHRCGLEAVGDESGVEAVLDLSRRAGVPAAELLRSEAEEARRSARAEAAAHASVLAVRLMLPLGLCVLPAFMVLGVAPLLIAVITSTVSGM
jgi:tight adherence protein B